MDDLVYCARRICESLRDRSEVLDSDEDLTDLVEEIEAIIDSI